MAPAVQYPVFHIMQDCSRKSHKTPSNMSMMRLHTTYQFTENNTENNTDNLRKSSNLL